jgi:integrase
MALPDPAAPPLAQAIEEFLDWQALDRGRSPNTVRAYRADLTGFQAFADTAGADQLADIDRDLLRAFQSAMARGGPGETPLSPQTRHRRLVALRSFLRFCAREEWTPGDLGHTWLDRGGPEGDLMELNGWTSPQMLRRYGASARSAYDRIMTDT